MNVHPSFIEARPEQFLLTNQTQNLLLDWKYVKPNSFPSPCTTLLKWSPPLFVKTNDELIHTQQFEPSGQERCQIELLEDSDSLNTHMKLE